jgi:hypothetical protein
LAAAGEREAVQLEPLVEALDDRLLGARFGERHVQVREQVVLRLDQEQPALAAGVGRLEDCGQADRLERRPRVGDAADRREARLRHACLGEPPPHRDLVRHQVGGLGADARQAQRLGDGGHDRDGAIGRDRQDAVDGVPAADLGDRLDVAEIDHLWHVGLGEPERVGVPVDGDDAQPELARALDRAALVPAGADEEDRPRHGGRC